MLDIVFPRTCVLCRATIETGDGEAPAGRHFCTSCRKSVELAMATPACPRCGHSVGPYGVHEGKCFACRNRRPKLNSIVRIGPYHDSMATLVRAFKYRGREELDAYLGRLLTEVIQLAPWCDSIDALACVPTHWRHAIGQPFYPPRALIRVVSRLSGIPSIRLLRRVAAGPHQFDVPLSKREDNIRGKFASAGGVEMDGATVCLIDDVSTSGSTLNECAKILKRSGAAAVHAAVLAKVDVMTRPVDGV